MSDEIWSRSRVLFLVFLSRCGPMMRGDMNVDNATSEERIFGKQRSDVRTERLRIPEHGPKTRKSDLSTSALVASQFGTSLEYQRRSRIEAEDVRNWKIQNCPKEKFCMVSRPVCRGVHAPLKRNKLSRSRKTMSGSYIWTSWPMGRVVIWI